MIHQKTRHTIPAWSLLYLPVLLLTRKAYANYSGPFIQHISVVLGWGSVKVRVPELVVADVSPAWPGSFCSVEVATLIWSHATMRIRRIACWTCPSARYIPVLYDYINCLCEMRDDPWFAQFGADLSGRSHPPAAKPEPTGCWV